MSEIAGSPRASDDRGREDWADDGARDLLAAAAKAVGELPGVG